ncbi:unnamed protein product [Dovyalis caffra]|uniref:Uncharacterized protein n=1 Tax=Dovyalis caffra TaxID=77055 RepID=A0AAV1R6Q7_9ROSI|nr:unnamed protein product [Dovyalis caffra]
METKVSARKGNSPGKVPTTRLCQAERDKVWRGVMTRQEGFVATNQNLATSDRYFFGSNGRPTKREGIELTCVIPSPQSKRCYD